MESRLELFDYYIKAIGRDGVPYDLVCQAVPTIESEVNNILNQIVDFGMTIDMDGKNINANIVREDRSWPLELNSGMESFICNLALRIALSNVSNLPRSNFLIIDEGLGSLDHEHLAAVYSLFGYLKTQFEFIILISHIDTSRDMVDMQLEIKKENGFSRVIC
jgi:DNA repair exonuclease SbcCD ATPase subunit